MFDQIPPELRNAGSGIAGSALALFFMRRTVIQSLIIFIGGCLVSYYATPWLVYVFDMDKTRDMLGFVAGLFGMALVGKAHDGIEAVNTSDIGVAVKDFIRKRLGV